MVDCFDRSQLPSLKLGMTLEEEALQRRKTCRFIEESGKVLSLPRVAVATAMVMFHRFYAKHSFQEHDRFEVAVACIVLAAKTEESPKKLNTVIIECHKLKMTGIKASATNSKSITPTHSPNHPSSSSRPSVPAELSSIILDIKSEEFSKLKERILLLERVILHTIGFELSIDHPYKFLIDQIRDIVVIKPSIEFITQPSNETDSSKSSSSSHLEMTKKLHTKLLQMSMNFANDSMHTSLCLQFEPKQIATACIFLGCHFAKIQPIPKQKMMMIKKNSNTNNTNPTGDDNNKITTASVNDWFEMLKYPDVDALSSISLQVLELIAERKGCDVSLLEKIRTLIEQLVSNDPSLTAIDNEPKQEDNEPSSSSKKRIDHDSSGGSPSITTDHQDTGDSSVPDSKRQRNTDS